MVQVGRGLVGQHELGVRDQRPRHGHPLLLSARYLVGIFVFLLHHPHGLQEGGNPLFPLLRGTFCTIRSGYSMFS